MSVFKKALAVVGAGIVLAAAVPTFASAARGLQEVLIANDDTQPVPTRPVGETTVNGSVAITGTPSVAVSGTPSVEIANQSPLDVALPATDPTRIEGNVWIGGTDGDPDRHGHQNGEPIATVPADKQFDIDFVTLVASSSVDDATLLEAFLLVSPPGAELAIYPLQVTPHPDGTGHAGIVSQQVDIHAPAGSTIAVQVSTIAPAQDGRFVAGLSGVMSGL